MAERTSPVVFVATNSHDYATVQPVIERISKKGHDLMVYEADKVAAGEIPLEMTLNRGASGWRIRYDGSELDPDAVGAAWLRRPSEFGDYREDVAVQLSVNRERRAAQSILWHTIPEKAWLNTPAATIRAQEKLQQLAMAQALGFNIPDTVVGNRWETIEERLDEGEIAFKAFRGVLHRRRSQDIESVFTKRFEDYAHLPKSGNPFPGIWQQFVEKRREWRITVVGDEAFDAAIYTDAAAQNDWREHQFGNNVVFRRETFPDEVAKEGCFELLEKYGGLKYGAFDFCESPDGQITFLEMNPSGQYGWLEEGLGLPISDAIADELLKTVRDGTA